MQRKVIKNKWVRIFLYVLTALIVIPASGYFALQSPAAQTWLTNRIAGYFSMKWGTTVRISGVDVELFKKVVLEGVFVEDLHHDTLLYSKKLKIDIGEFNRDSNTIFLRNVILQDAVCNLKKYKNDSVLNLQFIVDEFASTDTTRSKGKKWKLTVGAVTLNDVRFIYRDEKDTSHVRGINYFDLQANAINGKISDIWFDADTIRFALERFSLKEKSGFQLKELSSNEASISPARLVLNQARIFTNNSQITASIGFKYKSYSDFTRFVNDIKIKAQFNSSNVEMADIAYFSDALYGMHKKVFINGKVTGKVSDLKGKNMLLVIGDETSYTGDFRITGLPDINQTFMSFDAKDLRTSKAGIEKIPLPPFDQNNFIALPANVSLFGNIKFKGNFSGFYNDFVAYGNFTTALGNLSTDISLKEDTANSKVNYHGKFSCSDFNLGRFFESEKYVGLITLNVNIDGKGLKKENASLVMDGNVKSFGLNGYNYKNIDVKGKFARNIFDGVVAVKDENMDLDFNGNMDFSRYPTMLNFSACVNKANLSKVNLMKAEDNVSVSAQVAINGKGNNFDDATGEMKLGEIILHKKSETYNFKDLQFAISDHEGIKAMRFNSSFIDAQIDGKFKPIEVGSCLNDFLANYFPSRIVKLEQSEKNNKKAKDHIQAFTYAVQFKNTSVVTKAFFPGIDVTKPATLAGRYNEGKNDFYIEGTFPLLSYGKNIFTQCAIRGLPEENKLKFNVTCSKLAFSDSAWIENISLAAAAASDTLNFKVNWKNKSVQQYSGDIPGYISFAEPPNSTKGGDKPIKLKILPSQVTIADSTWRIDAGNEVVMDSSFISVRNLDFFCGRQRVKLEGNISKVKEDQMYLMLSSFSLENFNSALKGTGFALHGTVSGNTSVGNLYDKPVLGSSIDILDLKVNNELIGSGNLVSIYDSQKEAIKLNGAIARDEVGNIKFSGNYFPSRKENSLDMDAEMNNFHLGFFEPFLKDYLQNISGLASAQLKVAGTPDKPALSGTINTKVDNVHVNYLGTNYHLKGDVKVEPGSFDFSDITVYDVNENYADVVSGKMFHSNFKDLQLDMDVNVSKFLCINTTEKDNSVYYGKVFSTGVISVFGYLDNLDISANVKTDKAKNRLGKNEYTQLFVPLSGSGEIGENGFITFVKNDNTGKTNQPKYKVSTTGLTMDFKLEPTPDAQVQLIFDEKVGDVIKANGTGAIDMEINEFGDFKMYGDYLVESGDYLFTLKNVVNKKFRLEKGGTVRWSGDPLGAVINMNAIYELRTSLSPLFYDYEQTDATKKRYPVDLVMNLSGRLTQPDILFDVKLPTTDDFTRQQAFERFKNSDNELNKQVFSLLVMNSFVPADPSKNQQQGSKAGTVTSTEMLSNQLSNWLSQISNQFDVGVHYRPGDVIGDVINKDQVELALSTQLFNDKMTIDGTVANNTNTINTPNPSAVVGDVNIDYKLNENGKFRAKAYNKANEGDILNNQKGPYTQGVGIFYREEFETGKEFFQKIFRARKMKKEKK